MGQNFKKLVRTLQTHFPYLNGTKSAIQRAHYRWRRIPHDPDYYILKHFRVEPDSLFLDIGANRGQSIESFRTLLGNAPIHSFEPNTLLADQLAHRFKSRPSVTIHPFGLGSTEGEFILHVPFYNGWMFDGLASIIESEARDWLKSRIYGFTDRKLEVKPVQCRIKSLDSLQLKPIFVKIDVQGFELDVLRGGIETLNSCRPVVLLEEPTEEILEFARTLGYQLYSFENDRLVPGSPGGRSGFLVSDQHKSRLPFGS